MPAVCPATVSNNGDVEELFILAWSTTSCSAFLPLPAAFTAAAFVGSSSMYVKSDSGRGPVWLRELRILCKLCKLWTERRSSKSSRVDLNALITRSCKNREEDVLSGSEEASQRHTSTSYIYLYLFFLSQFSMCVSIYNSLCFSCHRLCSLSIYVYIRVHIHTWRQYTPIYSIYNFSLSFFLGGVCVW